MFGLIPIVITVILTGFIVASIAYFSGDVFSESADKAKARKLINEGEQIINSVKMYRMEKRRYPDDLKVDVLDDRRYYTGGSNSSWAFDGTLGGASIQLSGVDQCEAVNAELGYTDPVPSCSTVPAELAAKKYYCCTQ